MDILQSLLILLSLVAIGGLSRKLAIFNSSDVKVLSAFVYYFSLPALFFVKISRFSLQDYHPILIWGSVIPLVLVVVILKIMVWLKRIDKHQFILYSETVVFGSNAFFGLAFFEFFKGGQYLDYSILSASVLGVFGIVSAILLFEHADSKTGIFSFFKNILRNPLIISIALGFLCARIGLTDSFIHNALEMLGNAAPSIAIFVLGIFLYDHFSIELSVKSLIYAAFRFMAIPIAVLGTIYVLETFFYTQISFSIKQFLLLQSAIPAAISLVVFANRYNYKISEITGLVITTSILSFPMMVFLYWISYMVFK